MISLCDLNYDCLREIFNHLQKEDVLNLLQVSPELKEVGLDFVPKFRFTDSDLEQVTKKFSESDATLIFGSIRKVSLYEPKNYWSLFRKSVTNLDELKLGHNHKEEKNCSICSFLGQVRNLKMAHLIGLTPDKDTMKTFVANNHGIEYLKIVECRNMDLVATLPNVKTIYVEDFDDEYEDFFLKIAQMKSIRIALFSIYEFGVGFKRIMDSLAVTNVVESLVISHWESAYYQHVTTMDFSTTFSRLKCLKINFQANFGRTQLQELYGTWELKNLPNLEYLEFNHELQDLNYYTWLQKCPLLKEITCVDSFDCENEYFILEKFLADRNRSLTIQINPNFMHMWKECFHSNFFK